MIQMSFQVVKHHKSDIYSSQKEFQRMASQKIVVELQTLVVVYEKFSGHIKQLTTLKFHKLNEVTERHCGNCMKSYK